MLTNGRIAQAIEKTRFSVNEHHHAHEDCIRIAYEWLDAQVKLSAPNKRTTRPLKHIIERWAGRYVSTSDVEVAAHMHPEIRGKYPHFNISSRLVRPNQRRLVSVGQAHTQGYKEEKPADTYAGGEEP